MKQKLFGNTEKVHKQQIELISLLNQWYQVKEDLLFAFDKCASSEIGEPTIGYLQNFVTRIKGGLSIEQSLDLFAESYSDMSFRYFIKQISFNLKFRGNTGELLDNLETQFLKIDEEYTRRKIESSRDRSIIRLLFMSTPILIILLLFFKPRSLEFFIDTSFGNAFILLGCCFYFSGLIVLLSARKSKF